MSANKDFGAAVEALKSGQRVARAGWNGKGMFLFLNRGSADFDDANQPSRVPAIDGVPSGLFDNGVTGTGTRLPNINMRAASGATVTGWLASQTDILAEDWEVLDEAA